MPHDTVHELMLTDATTQTLAATPRLATIQ